jgi:DNA-binding transcriptional regulator LsrR (DeoR family)
MRTESKKVNRRLTQDQIEELEQGYRSGSTLSSLGEHFGLNRKTLAKALERRGVARRYRLMTDAGLMEARVAYESGQTLAEIGQDLGVSRDTVRRALLKDGVSIRPSRFGS